MENFRFREADRSKLLKKKFRVLHTREDGVHVPLLLQNKIIEAETPEDALRIAMNPFGEKTLNIESVNNYRAAAKQKDPAGKFIDVWESEAASLRYNTTI